MKNKIIDNHYVVTEKAPCPRCGLENQKKSGPIEGPSGRYSCFSNVECSKCGLWKHSIYNSKTHID